MIAVCDPGRGIFLGMILVGNPEAALEPQAWVLTDLDNLDCALRRLRNEAARVSILAFDVLGLDAE